MCFFLVVYVFVVTSLSAAFQPFKCQWSCDDTLTQSQDFIYERRSVGKKCLKSEVFYWKRDQSSSIELRDRHNEDGVDVAIVSKIYPALGGYEEVKRIFNIRFLPFCEIGYNCFGHHGERQDKKHAYEFSGVPAVNCSFEKRGKHNEYNVFVVRTPNDLSGKAWCLQLYWHFNDFVSLHFSVLRYSTNDLSGEVSEMAGQYCAPAQELGGIVYSYDFAQHCGGSARLLTKNTQDFSWKGANSDVSLMFFVRTPSRNIKCSEKNANLLEVRPYMQVKEGEHENWRQIGEWCISLVFIGDVCVLKKSGKDLVVLSALSRRSQPFFKYDIYSDMDPQKKVQCMFLSIQMPSEKPQQEEVVNPRNLIVSWPVDNPTMLTLLLDLGGRGIIADVMNFSESLERRLSGKRALCLESTPLEAKLRKVSEKRPLPFLSKNLSKKNEKSSRVDTHEPQITYTPKLKESLCVDTAERSCVTKAERSCVTKFVWNRMEELGVSLQFEVFSEGNIFRSCVMRAPVLSVKALVRANTAGTDIKKVGPKIFRLLNFNDQYQVCEVASRKFYLYNRSTASSVWDKCWYKQRVRDSDERVRYDLKEEDGWCIAHVQLPPSEDKKEKALKILWNPLAPDKVLSTFSDGETDHKFGEDLLIPKRFPGPFLFKGSFIRFHVHTDEDKKITCFLTRHMGWNDNGVIIECPTLFQPDEEGGVKLNVSARLVLYKDGVDPKSLIAEQHCIRLWRAEFCVYDGRCTVKSAVQACLQDFLKGVVIGDGQVCGVAKDVPLVSYDAYEVDAACAPKVEYNFSDLNTCVMKPPVGKDRQERSLNLHWNYFVNYVLASSQYNIDSPSQNITEKRRLSCAKQ